MAFQLEAGEPVGRGLLRIVGEQIDGAVGRLRAEGEEPDERIHEVRKHIKKIRAVLRLLRPALGAGYVAENAWYRELSRQLAAARDAGALVECFGRLTARLRDEVEEATLVQLRAALVRRRPCLPGDLEREMGRTAAALEAARGRLSCWPVPSRGFDALAPGLRRTYRRGRRAFAAARLQPDAEHFHEWRKSVKAFWYQMRLLAPAWPEVLPAYVGAVDALAEALGDLHDLDVLHRAFLQEPALYEFWQLLPPLARVLEERQEELRETAAAAGRRIYAEKPGALVARLRLCWEAWQEEAAGPLVAA